MRRAALLALALGACTSTRDAAPPVAALDSLPSPAGAGSGEPSLVTDAKGRVWLSWLEPASDSTHAMRIASFGGNQWSAARDVVRSRDLVVNWADFPGLAASASGRLAAYWLARGDTGKYAYGVRVAQSTDDGATWSAPITPHRDAGPVEHGFVAMWPTGGDSIALAWLDGRKDAMRDSVREMMVQSATIGANGIASAEHVLDARSCDCCQTAVALTSSGPIVAYRDRSSDEIRDVVTTRLVKGAWTTPAPVHADGWHIEACPVNGPQLSARGDTVAIAWFTAARDTAKVQLAFSTDGGATWREPVRIDDGQPAGRVDVELDGGGRAIVSWIERVGASPAPAVPAPRENGGRAEVRLRAVSLGGSRSGALTVASSTGARASGFPRMSRSGDHLIVAWTEPGPPSRVRVARATLPSSR